MKVFVIVNNYLPKDMGKKQGYYFLADSAVSNSGKPFYLPRHLGRTMVSLSGAVRFDRLGKSVKEKFASRYYSFFAPSLHFFLPDYAETLKSENLPQDPARNFDKSLIAGEFMTIENAMPFVMKINGNEAGIFDLKALHSSVDKMIEEISRLNTIKMGDLMLPAISRPVQLNEGDLIEVFAGDEKAFHCRVK